MTAEPCRLCGGSTTEAFSRTVLGHLDVRYFRCDRCQSLETETPYWLDEAYEIGGHSDHDTGAVMRNLDKQAVVVSTLHALRLPRDSRVLDFGGGTGLLCRLMRDAGIDAWLYEPKGSRELSRGFEVDALDRHFDLVCSFEVVEHLTNPFVTLGELAAVAHSALLIGTQPYLGQLGDWPYLAPETGQHVFFVSPRGFSWFAAEVGLHHLDFGHHQLLTREPVPRALQKLLRLVFGGPGLRAQRALLAFRAGYGPAERDAGMAR